MDQSGDGGMPLRMEGKDIADWLSIDKDRFFFYGRSCETGSFSAALL